MTAGNSEGGKPRFPRRVPAPDRATPATIPRVDRGIATRRACVGGLLRRLAAVGTTLGEKSGREDRPRYSFDVDPITTLATAGAFKAATRRTRRRCRAGCRTPFQIPGRRGSKVSAGAKSFGGSDADCRCRKRWTCPPTLLAIISRLAGANSIAANASAATMVSAVIEPLGAGVEGGGGCGGSTAGCGDSSRARAVRGSDVAAAARPVAARNLRREESDG